MWHNSKPFNLRSLLQRLLRRSAILLEGKSSISEWSEAYVWPTKGDQWEVAGLAEIIEKRWGEFKDTLTKNRLFAIPYEYSCSINSDIISQTNYLAFSHVVASACLEDTPVSILDFGGGLGHYGAILNALFPSMPIDYCCAERESILEIGKRLNISCRFQCPESAFKERFSIVMASSTLQYIYSWRETLKSLATCSTKYLFLARTCITETDATFMLKQEVGSYGLKGSLVSWCFKKSELLNELEQLGFLLEREFIAGTDITIAGHCPIKERSFLMRRVSSQ